MAHTGWVLIRGELWTGTQRRGRAKRRRRELRQPQAERAASGETNPRSSRVKPTLTLGLKPQSLRK